MQRRLGRRRRPLARAPTARKRCDAVGLQAATPDPTRADPRRRRDRPALQAGDGARKGVASRRSRQARPATQDRDRQSAAPASPPIRMNTVGDGDFVGEPRRDRGDAGATEPRLGLVRAQRLGRARKLRRALASPRRSRPRARGRRGFGGRKRPRSSSAVAAKPIGPPGSACAMSGRRRSPQAPDRATSAPRSAPPLGGRADHPAATSPSSARARRSRGEALRDSRALRRGARRRARARRDRRQR